MRIPARLCVLEPQRPMAEWRTVHVGLLLVFLLLVLAASVPQQDLPLFGHSLGGCLAHRTLPTDFSIIVAVVCTQQGIGQPWLLGYRTHLMKTETHYLQPVSSWVPSFRAFLAWLSSPSSLSYHRSRCLRLRLLPLQTRCLPHHCQSHLQQRHGGTWSGDPSLLTSPVPDAAPQQCSRDNNNNNKEPHLLNHFWIWTACRQTPHCKVEWRQNIPGLIWLDFRAEGRAEVMAASGLRPGLTCHPVSSLSAWVWAHEGSRAPSLAHYLHTPHLAKQQPLQPELDWHSFLWF